MLTPRDYQLVGKDFILKYKRVILADEMGIGKTGTTLLALKKLAAQVNHDLKILVLCTSNGIPTWTNGVKLWDAYDDPITIVQGPKAKRKELWNENFVISTYGIPRRNIREIPTDWDVIICDEGHKANNRKTNTFKALRRLKARYLFVIVTGTPTRRGAQDLWALLSLLKPNVFRSYWKFVNTFCHIIDTMYGKEIIGTKNIENLRLVLSTIMIRRTKKEVLPELPGKTRQLLHITMTPDQKITHYKLVENLIAELPSEAEKRFLIAPNQLANIIRIRQLLITPKLLDPGLGIGSALPAILEHLRDNTNDHHFVIFTPFIKAIPIFKEYLVQEGFEADLIYIFQGGLKPDELDRRVKAFKEQRGIGICSIAYAQSFDLDSCSTGYFIGALYDVNDNIQAEDRMHRMTSKNAVNIFYVRYDTEVEEDLFGILNVKFTNTNMICRPITSLVDEANQRDRGKNGD